ncbi:hypothetical protein C8E08_0545 [Paracidovorax citrulli]|nr:hypothetical protein C8E08_0545 [Paracidovorax citrulli]QCX12445.1 hypothetical protein APS58_3719 [Paracidovorax citrulli]REG67759.1 hypothetical protein C8E07_0842 [Paracidovorax citrulli]RLJ92319.1 hypothetical protein C8E06_0843 [Paracidovorax citrulli]SDK92318.1 hypothetical protein SAMN04489709_12672 [Paracidovorax citrulli]
MAPAVVQADAAGDAGDVQRQPLRGGADADDCAICAHFAGTCVSLAAPLPPSVPGPVSGAPRLPPARTAAPLPRVAWLLAASRAPPPLSASI